MVDLAKGIAAAAAKASERVGLKGFTTTSVVKASAKDEGNPFKALYDALVGTEASSKPSRPRVSVPKKPDGPLAQVYQPYVQEEIPESPGDSWQANLGDLQKEYANTLDSLNPKDRFSIQDAGDRLALYTRSREQQVEQAVKRPPAPVEFQSLQVGPEARIEYEASLVPSVEMSQALLRSLSPFMIQVEPPIAFGEDGGFLARQGNNICLNTFANAARGCRGYEASRKALAQSTLALGVNGKVGSLQQFIKANTMQVQATATQEVKPAVSQTNLGEPAIADLLSAVDVAWQLASVMQIPPLVLLVNPTTLQIAYNKIQQFQERTRYGFVFQAWGEEQPKLTITARCGAFASGQRGVQYASKRDSLAWQNLMNAFHFYRSNGYLYDTIGRSNAHPFVGALSIHFDQWVYYGHMESFTWTYDESNQLGGVEFSIEFVVSAMADTAQQPFVVMPMHAPTPSPSDPRYFGLENRSRSRPGETSISLDTNGFPIAVSAQGRIATGSGYGILVPGDYGVIGGTKTGGGTGGRGTGKGNFQAGGATSQRIVETVTSQFSVPFGLR